MPLVAQSAVSCIARGTGVGFVMGVCALVVLACVVACLTYHTVRTLAQLMECGPPGRGGWLEPACEWRLRGDDHASTKTATLTPEQLCACFGAYFEDYHYASRWWLTVELTVALVSGMIGGLMDTSAGRVRGAPCAGRGAERGVPGAAAVASSVPTAAGHGDMHGRWDAAAGERRGALRWVR